MSAIQYHLTNKQHDLLVESLRRYECFTFRAGRGGWNLADMQKEHSGLGFRSEYEPVTKAGLMVVMGNYAQRCLGGTGLPKLERRSFCIGITKVINATTMTIRHIATESSKMFPLVLT